MKVLVKDSRERQEPEIYENDNITFDQVEAYIEECKKDYQQKKYIEMSRVFTYLIGIG